MPRQRQWSKKPGRASCCRARWASVAGYGLYFYAAERHRRPHYDVRRGGEHATLDVLTGEILAGELSPRVESFGPSSRCWPTTGRLRFMPSAGRWSTDFQVLLDAETEATDD